MNNEIDDMIEMYSKSKGDVKISTDFNLPIINILWQLVSGNRILPEDREGSRMVELVNEIFLTGKIALSSLKLKIIMIKYIKNYFIRYYPKGIFLF